MLRKVSYKKGHGELPYIIFIAVFIVMMTIIGKIMTGDTIRTKVESDNGLLASISVLLNGVPIVGTFWSFVMTTYEFVYVYPNLALIYTAIIGVPLGYLVLRLIRGGG